MSLEATVRNLMDKNHEQAAMIEDLSLKLAKMEPEGKSHSGESVEEVGESDGPKRPPSVRAVHPLTGSAAQ